MCLDSAFFFPFSPILILFIVQALHNAADWKRTTKVNSISHWLSQAQLKTKAPFFIAFRMHSLLHKSLFHGTYRLRRLTAFRFLHHWYQKSIPDLSCLMLTKDQNVYRDTHAPTMLSFSYLYDKLDNTL